MSPTRPSDPQRPLRASPPQTRPAAARTAASPLIARSVIRAVTVYADCAYVTRRVTIRLNPGIHTIEVRGLPAGLDLSSLSAAVMGSPHPRLLKTLMRQEDETSATLIRSLESQLQAIQGQIDRADASIAVLRADRLALRSMVNSVVSPDATRSDKGLSPDKRLTTLDTLGERAEQINARLQQAIVERNSLDRELRRHQLKLDALPERQDPEGHIVQLQVEVTRSGDLIAEISYLVPKASWVPFYELHLSEPYGQSLLRILYSAEIRQATGEDWHNVEITLSDGKPSPSNLFVELEPWLVSVLPSGLPADGPSSAAPSSGEPQLSSGAPGGEADPAGLGSSPFAMVVSGASGPENRYPLGKPRTIPSDGAIHTATVLEFSVEPDVSYISAPRRSPRVYRRLRATNTAVLPLLPGTANLFLEGTYIGTRALPLTNPSEPLEVFLGTEERITAQAELLQQVEERRHLAPRQRLFCTSRINIRSDFDWPIKLTLYDQIPTARDDTLTVRLASTDPAPAAQNALGTLQWELALDAHETRTVQLDFVLEHPRDSRIVGLS